MFDLGISNNGDLYLYIPIGKYVLEIESYSPRYYTNSSEKDKVSHIIRSGEFSLNFYKSTSNVDIVTVYMERQINQSIEMYVRIKDKVLLDL